MFIKKAFLITASVYVLLFALPIIVYFSVSGHQFLDRWDDNWMVLNYYTADGLSLQNLAAIFNETNNGQYSPVNQLIYTILFSIFGADPRVFHLASVIYHAINSCLVFTFAKKLLGLRQGIELAPKNSKGRKDESRDLRLISGNGDLYERLLRFFRFKNVTFQRPQLVTVVAFITALLFSVHPVNTESVAWISASKIPLYTMFGLLALLCYMRYLQSDRMGWLAGCGILFVLSFGCKEQAVALPLALPLIDWYAGRDFKKKKLWFEKIPFLALVLLGGLYTMSLRNINFVEYYAGYPLWQRLIFACYALTEYPTKLIVPINLLYIYPFPMPPGDSLPLRFLIYPVIFAAITGVIVYYRKHALLVFCTLFFVLNVSLTLHILSMSRVTIVADRWIYLSGIAFFMAIAWYAIKYFLTLSKLQKIAAILAFVIYLFYLTGYTMKRSEVWHDNSSLKKEINDLIKQREDYEPEEIEKIQENTMNETNDETQQ